MYRLNTSTLQLFTHIGLIDPSIIDKLPSDSHVKNKCSLTL